MIFYKSKTSVMKFSLCGILICSFLFFALSCKKDNGDFIRFSELGAVNTEYVVDSAAGEVAVQVYSNENFKVSTDTTYSWVHLDSVGKTEGDTSFNVRYDANPGLPRMCKIVIYASESQRYDTVVVKQKGSIDPTLAFVNSNISILGKNDSTISVVLHSTVPSAQIKDSIMYLDSSQNWVSKDFKFSKDSIFSFLVKANPSQTKLRNAQITLYFTDGWGIVHSTTLHILQSNAQNLFGEEVAFTDVRNWAGDVISSDIFIEGYVVSNKESQNMGDILRTTPTTVDYSTNTTTAYIESLDGRYGFKIITTSADNNVFAQYSKVQILLRGTSVELESNPDRYTITGVTSGMVMSQVPGSVAGLPKKQKSMAALTDDDIYTYVTLADCEFPVRKGPLTPINEGYSTLYNANRIAKYPLLMRDEAGNSMFLLTNVTCPYRRDGSMLPYGSGNISGIIVHETDNQFEYEDASNENDYGNIGRYQVRHTNRSDIQLAADIDNGFSKLLTEYQYPNLSSGVAYPTYGNNGSIRSSAGVNIVTTSDWTYLGTCGSANLGNTNQYGTGVVLANGTKQNTSTSTNSDGKGAASGSALSTNCLWWNANKNRGEAWIVEFSTSGVTTNQLSLQFTAYDLASSGAGTPRFWRVDWSETGDMDGTWNTIAYYTVPDASNWSNTLMSQLPAFKNINIPLPLSMLGKQQVYLRLIVDKDLCSNGQTYATVPLTKSSASALGYLAIRYNK